MLDLIDLQSKAESIILNAGNIILQSNINLSQLHNVDIRDQSTNVDKTVEDYLINELNTIFPEAGFILEEGKNQEKNKYNWIIDPIDGTKEFIHQTPMFFTQFALLENNIPILGLIYQPISKQLFSASKNNGAKINNNKVQKVPVRPITESIIDLDIRGNELSSLKVPIINKLFVHAYRIRISGARLAPYLLLGEIDAFIDMFREKKPFDLAPRAIIFQEAGYKNQIINVKNSHSISVYAQKQLLEEITKILL